METHTYAVTKYLRGKTYYASYKLPGQRKVGKSLGTQDATEAEAKRAELEASINSTLAAATSTPDNGATFRQLAENHLRYQKGDFSSSYVPVAHIVNATMVPFFGDKPVAEITLEDCNAWKFKQQERGLAAGTLRQYIKRLRAIFNYAVKHKYITETPARNVVMPKAPKKKNYRDKVMTPAQVQALCNYSSAYYASVWELLVNTGMRPNEVRQIRLGDIVGNELHLPGDITKTGEDRTIPLNEDAQLAVKHLINEKRIDAHENREEYKPSAGDLLLKPTYATGVLSRAFRTARGKAGLEQFNLYCLRHTFISTLANGGVPVPTVSELAGHDQIETTMAYIHVEPGAARTAVDTLSFGTD